ncbi:hypothetical protein [Compostimonas suwonensis]|uniref:Uncharacterized protein n=1 Tax=Compostimonas suwonensis TaxID=1048394 RepID=A0A2M9BTR4_9MICO|nr:hypothetical protein [Compostimonas suwonensis]PJJ61302.1 hypothetical protein CLV54_2246 [Compostimonas suwonensis]
MTHSFLLAPLLLEGGVLMLAAAALLLAVLAVWLGKHTLIASSAASLALAIGFACLPNPTPGPGYAIVLGAITLALAVVGGAPAATWILSLATKGSVTAGLHGGIVVDDDSRTGVTTAPHEVLRGGLMIGLLERAAIAGTILAGFPEGIAVVVAVKGVGRFTELAAAEARERFIIGTLASIGWACASAILVRLMTA